MKTWDEVNVVVEGGLSYEFPPMYKIRQTWPSASLEAPAAVLGKQLQKSYGFQKIKAGDRIAIAVGSRGIDQLQTVVRRIVEEVRKKGGYPFVFPAMGSHGGATAEGQKKILQAYGITEETVGAPIVTSMDVVEVGVISNGVSLCCDKNAYQSDGIIVVNRVKPHTSFRGELESGLTKMMVIGMGKHKGATAFHQYGFGAVGDMLLEAATIYLQNAPILIGVALLENAYDLLSVIQVVETADWIEQEKKLLRQARLMMPRLPLDDIDVLIVDEMGKNISGAGMDPNVINRAGSPSFIPSPTPRINKLVVLDLTDESAGNAIGVGVADIVSRRLVDKINLSNMYANAITSTVMAGSRIPVTMPNDRDTIAVAIRTCNARGPVRMVRIKNTLHLSELWVSEGCLDQLKENPNIMIMHKSSMEFDERGQIHPF